MGRHKYRWHPLYYIWGSIKQRIYNKNCHTYSRYGGRGIQMCDEWQGNPVSFIEWALENGWKKGLCIDRVDNDGNYTPKNCRFIDRGLSTRNSRLLISTNKTGYRGVHKSNRHKSNPYISSIWIDGKQRHLGVFPSPGLAGLRYDVEAYLLNDGRPMNFIEEVI